MAKMVGKQLDTSPEAEENLGAAIRRISVAMDKLLRNGLNHDAIVVLLKDASGLPKTTIETVLYQLSQLEKRYGR